MASKMGVSSGANLAGILGRRRCGFGRLDEAWVVGEGAPLPTGGVWEGGRAPPPKLIFLLYLVHSERYFCPCPRQKKC